MKVIRTGRCRASVVGVSGEQLGVVVRSMGELNGVHCPDEWRGAQFRGWLDDLTLKLSKGAGLFRAERSRAGVSTVFRLRRSKRK